MDNELKCIVEQIRQEKETKKVLKNLHLSDGRKEQIIEKRKAEIRRRCGLTGNKSVEI